MNFVGLHCSIPGGSGCSTDRRFYFQSLAYQYSKPKGPASLQDEPHRVGEILLVEPCSLVESIQSASRGQAKATGRLNTARLDYVLRSTPCERPTTSGQAGKWDSFSRGSL